MENKTFFVKGMTCEHCVKAVKYELKELELNSINAEIGKIDIEYDSNKISYSEIVKAIENAGYQVEK
jgi:copper chaperone